MIGYASINIIPIDNRVGWMGALAVVWDIESNIVVLCDKHPGMLKPLPYVRW
jgi:hypothetical protein